MGSIEILLIAVSLAMDSFALSITCGIILRRIVFKDVMRIALYMGVFQAIMPVIGWLMGVGMRQYIQSYDHWIAFILLALLGSKMVYEHFKEDDESADFDPSKHFVLLGFAIATSIDALVVGVNFAFLGVSILWPVAAIGLVAFLFSFIGVHLGGRFGHAFDFKAELLAGLLLIGLGVKILFEHLIAQGTISF